MMNPNKLPRPSDLVYGMIKKRIMVNALQPGDVLTELGQAHEIGCSQGTVREALLRLQEEGLVVRTGHRGTTVTRLDPDEAQEMLALRRHIEMRGARRACRAAQPHALAELTALRDQMTDAAHARDEYLLTELDKEFHLTIFRLANLHALEPILIRCIMNSHRAKLWAPGHRRPLTETARRHDILIERFAAGDGEGLAAALGQHIDTIVQEDERSVEAAE